MDRFDSNYNHQFTSTSSSSSSSGDLSIESSSCGGDDSTPLERDYFDGVLKYINQMLMEEEDLENRPCMLQDSLALQAAEKSFYEALTDCNFSDERNRKRDSYGDGEGRASKLVSGFTAEESEQTEVYDKTLLCSANNPGFYSDPPWCHLDYSTEQTPRFTPAVTVQSKRGRPRAGEKRVGSGKPVDLRSLLLESAEAAANYNGRTASDRLKLIRQHSYPYGDAAERTAHYFANSLEARLAGTGTDLYTAFSRRRMSAAEMQESNGDSHNRFRDSIRIPMAVFHPGNLPPPIRPAKASNHRHRFSPARFPAGRESGGYRPPPGELLQAIQCPIRVYRHSRQKMGHNKFG